MFDDHAAEMIMDLTGGRGADAIIDLVGTDATLALAAAVSRPHGRIVLVGLEGGSLAVGWGPRPASLLYRWAVLGQICARSANWQRKAS
jgi:threonine dehydrogenase-like Zn-dependent dehydrogenase